MAQGPAAILPEIVQDLLLGILLLAILCVLACPFLLGLLCSHHT